jgi:hypothetical protein
MHNITANRRRYQIHLHGPHRFMQTIKTGLQHAHSFSNVKRNQGKSSSPNSIVYRKHTEWREQSRVCLRGRGHVQIGEIAMEPGDREGC